jgi:hypothetical protein
MDIATITGIEYREIVDYLTEYCAINGTGIPTICEAIDDHFLVSLFIDEMTGREFRQLLSEVYQNVN